MIAKILCVLYGHQWYTIWTAGAGDIWGEGCLRCRIEIPSGVK